MHWFKVALISAANVFAVMLVVNQLGKANVPVFSQIRGYVWG
jgi:hypothetical protein